MTISDSELAWYEKIQQDYLLSVCLQRVLSSFGAEALRGFYAKRLQIVQFFKTLSVQIRFIKIFQNLIYYLVFQMGNSKNDNVNIIPNKILKDDA